jgi:hypothetical protein
MENLTPIVVHIEVTLDKGPEHGIELESKGLAVAEELLLNVKPSLMRGATALTDDVLQLNCEHAKDTGEDDIVHPLPMGKSGGSSVRDDMVVTGVALQCQQDEVASASIVVRKGDEDDGD